MTNGRGEADGARWRMLALMSLAVLLGMSLWFAANSVAPQLRERWGLDASQAGWLTAVVQLGFVAGTATAALLNLADLFPSRGFFAACAALAALANLALIAAPSYALALVGRFFTGFFLAGVYPPAMKMIATWFRSGRGFAIGALIGALTVGQGLPYLVRAIGGAQLGFVVLSTSAGALGAAAMVAWGFRDGPYEFPRRPFSWGLVGVVLRDRDTRLAIGSYLGHMWELYAMWVWLPAFVAASLELGGPPDPRLSNLIVFGMLVSGGVGCVWAGSMAARWGYAKVVTVALAASGACSLGVGLCFGASLWVLVPLLWCWGFFIVADSAQFSALVTETAPPHAVGTALTLQTSMGFLLTLLTIQMVPAIVGVAGWRWAFPALALGPVAGIAAIARLGKRAGR